MKGVKKRVLDEDLSKVGTALQRAAKQARKIAQRTHTPLAIYEQGRVMRRKHGGDKVREEPGPPRCSQAVRLRAPGREALVRRVKSLFQGEDVERWNGCFVVITENKIRIRHPEKPKG